MRMHIVAPLLDTCKAREELSNSYSVSYFFGLWWLAPSLSLLFVRSDQPVYVRSIRWHTRAVPASPPCLHKGVLKYFLASLSNPAFLAKCTHNNHIFMVGTEVGRCKRMWKLILSGEFRN